MYQDHQSLPGRFYKEQCKEGDAVREAENKIKWRERVATSVAPQRSLTTG